MKLSQKFTLRSMRPLEGGLSGFWLSVQPTEVANAVNAGTGPGVPDDTGTPQAGTIKPGSLVGIASTTADPFTSPDLSVAGTIADIPYVVFSGDDDFSGSFVGEALVVHGPGRFDTEAFDAGVYPPGAWLIGSAVVPGNFALKVVGDHKQIVAKVGLRGVLNGVMDVIQVQGVRDRDV